MSDAVKGRKGEHIRKVFYNLGKIGVEEEGKGESAKDRRRRVDF